MRRRDREVIGQENITLILKEAKVLRYAFKDKFGFYVVPVNYAYAFTEAGLELYFHGSKFGRRAEAMKNGPILVGFELDCGHELIIGNKANKYSYRYASVSGSGSLSLLSGPEALKSMRLLMEQQTGSHLDVTEAMLEACNVYRLIALEYTGKSNGYPDKFHNQGQG